MLSRFHLIPACDGQTDGRRYRIAISISRVSVLTRDKKIFKQDPAREDLPDMLNDVARAFAVAGLPVIKEPAGLVRHYGKRSDGLILIPFEGSRSGR